MSINTHNSDDEYLLTFTDLVNIVKKNKRRIGFWTLIFAFLGFIYAATKPIEYQATATFKEKGKAHSGISKSLSAIFLGADGSDSDALTMMKSRKLVEQLIKDTGLQAVVTQPTTMFPFTSLKTIKDNLVVEYALFRKLTTPVLQDPQPDIKVEQVIYSGEIPKTLRLNILGPNTFALFDSDKQSLGEGTFGQLFTNSDFSITLVSLTSTPAKEYFVTLLPLGRRAETISANFKVEPDYTDKGLIKISYNHRDRHQASAHARAFMQIYQNYIRSENDRINDIQSVYLRKRQREMGEQLEEDIMAYAKQLSADISTTGFANSSKAIDFLAKNEQELKQKLLTSTLETQKLENIYQNNCQNLACIQNYDTFNNFINKLHDLKQRADSLSLAIISNSTSQVDFQDSFTSQLSELNEVQECSKEAQFMLESLQKNLVPKECPHLINNPKYIVNTWIEQLSSAKNSGSNESWQKNKEGFFAYLTQLIHFFKVYQRNLEEHLAHQQAPMLEFQGITLNTAEELYKEYSRQLSDTESKTIQQQFLIKQINEPNFEITSLSNSLNDNVSAAIITKASQLVLALKDQTNINSREQERHKADLAVQKSFLINHLQQNITLLELQQNFLKDKIKSLQSINLSLVHEQISIIENQIKNYLKSLIERQKNDQEILQANIDELHSSMAGLPKKWATEKLIGQEMMINRHLVEEITKLVESKTINDNLEKIQSAPVDLPLTPIHPKSPRLLLFAFIGAIMGAFLCFTWVLVRSVSKGIEASAASLQTIKQHVSGRLSKSNEDYNNKPILDSDLETLRRLASFIELSNSKDENHPHNNSLFLIENTGPKYADIFSSLMAQRGYKILLLDLSFDNPLKSPGLLQYLQGDSELKIVHEKNFDKIYSGGVSRFANEMLDSQKFKTLLQSWQKQYDWVIAFSSCSPNSATAECLLAQFSHAAITLTGETQNQLTNCIRLAKSKNIKLSFIVV